MKRTDDRSTIKANFNLAKVLVIEDNDDHWTVIKRAMQECLSEVTSVRAATSAQALSLLNDWQTQEWELPKLILLDLYLPGISDGWDVLNQIRSMPPPFNQIPVIMLSASELSDDIFQAYQSGISSYLVKPVDFKDWLKYFQELRAYWWETVSLPPLHFKF